LGWLPHPWFLEASLSYSPNNGGLIGGGKSNYLHENAILTLGGFKPFEKYARQNENLPSIGMK